ncbi:MAG: Hsp70 family protein, partial [Polyangiaceae bacterium]|nr:Hsp70 family protein [Polyangiaceae bacterium]
RRRISSYFGKMPQSRINPDEVVAIGAALQAAALESKQSDAELPKPPIPRARAGKTTSQKGSTLSGTGTGTTRMGMNLPERAKAPGTLSGMGAAKTDQTSPSPTTQMGLGKSNRDKKADTISGVGGTATAALGKTLAGVGREKLAAQPESSPKTKSGVGAPAPSPTATLSGTGATQFTPPKNIVPPALPKDKTLAGVGQFQKPAPPKRDNISPNEEKPSGSTLSGLLQAPEDSVVSILPDADFDADEITSVYPPEAISALKADSKPPRDQLETLPGPAAPPAEDGSVVFDLESLEEEAALENEADVSGDENQSGDENKEPFKAPPTLNTETQVIATAEKVDSELVELDEITDDEEEAPPSSLSLQKAASSTAQVGTLQEGKESELPVPALTGLPIPASTKSRPPQADDEKKDLGFGKTLTGGPGLNFDSFEDSTLAPMDQFDLSGANLDVTSDELKEEPADSLGESDLSAQLGNFGEELEVEQQGATSLEEEAGGLLSDQAPPTGQNPFTAPHEINPPLAPQRGAETEPLASPEGLGTSPRAELNAPLLVDVTPLSLGIEVVGGYTGRLIEKNSPIPCEKTRLFATTRDGQQLVSVRVCQGESDHFEENTLLGTVELTNLAPAPRGQTTVSISFNLDESGVLNIQAQDPGTGQAAQAQLRLVGAAAASE